jgi:putative DNA primase/helicase
VDCTGAAERFAKSTIALLYRLAATLPPLDEEALTNHARASESAPRIHAMLDLAASEPGVPVLPEQLDRGPLLLNCANGTLDLQTGRLRPHAPADLLTSLCAVEYDPAARCPTWERALDTMFAGNAESVAFLRRFMGYSLTADVSEQALLIFFGAGGNGKSVIFETARGFMGPDYAAVGADELVVSRRYEPHPTGVADLCGRRLVTVAETGEDGRMNERLVKMLTGGEAIKGRRMREDFWSFAQTHKLWLASNHLPEVRGADDGIWRRILLVHLKARFWDPGKKESGPPHLEADKTLVDRLKQEYPGILAWAVGGCREWLRRRDLRAPPVVVDATREYRREEDVVGRFLSENCVLGPQQQVPAGALYKAFQDWRRREGEREPFSQRQFGRNMMGRGFRRCKSNRMVYLGVALAPGSPAPAAGEGGANGAAANGRAGRASPAPPSRLGQASVAPDRAASPDARGAEELAWRFEPDHHDLDVIDDGLLAEAEDDEFEEYGLERHEEELEASREYCMACSEPMRRGQCRYCVNPDDFDGPAYGDY